MVSLYAFDVDGTLTESKCKISVEIRDLLMALGQRDYVALVTGGSYEKLLELLDFSSSPSQVYRNFFLLPCSGALAFRFGQDGTWDTMWQCLIQEYKARNIERSFDLAKHRARTHAEKIAHDIAVPPDDTTIYGPVYEHRGGQVTFSLLGQQAPVDKKREWNLKYSGWRLLLANALQNDLEPQYRVAVGGLTSIDVTDRNINKASGLTKLCQAEPGARNKFEVIYFGDAFGEGENDRVVFDAGFPCVKVSSPSQVRGILAKLVSFRLNC